MLLAARMKASSALGLHTGFTGSGSGQSSPSETRVGGSSWRGWVGSLKFQLELAALDRRAELADMTLAVGFRGTGMGSEDWPHRKQARGPATDHRWVDWGPWPHGWEQEAGESVCLGLSQGGILSVWGATSRSHQGGQGWEW